MRHSFNLGSPSSGRRVLKRLEVCRKAAPRAVEANSTRNIGAAERFRGLTKRQLLPRNEAQNLTVSLGEPSKRLRKHRIADELDLACLPVAGRDAGSGGCPILVRQCLASHREKPRQRLVRHPIQPPPANDERFGYHVLNRVGFRPSADVRAHRIDVARVDALKSLLRRPLHSHPVYVATSATVTGGRPRLRECAGMSPERVLSVP